MAKEKKQWYFMKRCKGAILSEDLFSGNGFQIPVRVFINSETGKVRLFATYIVEEKGVENILSKLENKNE